MVVLFVTCRKNTHWDTQVKIPLITSTLDLKDIFSDTIAFYNPDQSVSLRVTQPINPIDYSELVKIHDTLAHDVTYWPFSFDYMLWPDYTFVDMVRNYRMDLGTVEIKEARAKNAVLKFIVVNHLEERLRIEYEISSSEKNGFPFSVSDDIPAASNNTPYRAERNINLAGYTMDFTGPNFNQSNFVISKTLLKIHPDGDSVLISQNDSIIATSIFDHLEIDYARGYFGQSSEHVHDTVNLSVFDNFASGLFDLDKVMANLLIENGMGADVQMRINELTAYNSKSGAKISLNHSGIGQNKNILRATETGNPNFPVIPTKYSDDWTFTNIQEMIEIQPDKLIFDIDFKTNPLGNISGYNDFIYADYPLNGFISMEIPLKLDLNHLTIEELTTINFDDESIKSGNLIIKAANYFPFDVSLQFYLQDDLGNTVDSLIQGNIMVHSGLLSAQDFVQQPSEEEMIVPLTPAILNKLRTHNKILVRSVIHNNYSKKIQLWEHYRIDIQVILDADYEI